MKLLGQSFRGLQPFLVRGPWFWCGVAVVVVSLEVLGRHTHSDLFDAVSALVLVMLAFLVAARNAEAPLAWLGTLKYVAQGIRNRLVPWTFRIGIDLRGQPPVPRAVPLTLVVAVLLLMTWAAIVGAVGFLAPDGFRGLALRISYVGYLLLLMALWSAIAFCSLVTALTPVGMMHDRFVAGFTRAGRRPRRREFLCVGAYFAAVSLAAAVLPAWVPLILIGLAWLALVSISLLAPENGIRFVWGYRGRAVVWWMPFGQWLVWQFTLASLVIIDLALSACGWSLVLGDVDFEAMPITSLLGTTLIWLAPGALWAVVAQLATARMHDPSSPCPPTLHLAGPGLAKHATELGEFFRQHRWKVRTEPAAPGAADVAVEVTSDLERPQREGEVRWPLRASSEQLTEGTLLERLARRNEIQQRRCLIAGLERLFKLAARRKYRSGSGTWVAPHLWFITGLSRDTEEDTVDFEGTLLSGMVGPPYHHVLPQSARHHAYLILRALQVDLIFVEDGVGFRRFRRILRMMFELYDIHGGRQRAEEIHFQGAVGTRVLIHDFQLDEPFESEVYPEPDYENLGRARILHIFRDRGEQLEPLETPMDDTRVPVLGSMR
jgi:hypothetical protein